MFVDYLTLIMVNLIAGTALLAYFVFTGLKPNKGLVAGFGIVGLIALVVGLHLTFTWPLPGSYNIIYGEATTLFGAVFLGAALALAKEWDLYPVTLYAFFAGIYAVIAGWQIIAQGLTKAPIPSGLGFILAGLGGVFSPIALKFKENKLLRWIAIAVLLATIVLWGVTWYVSLSSHIQSFSKWVPDSMLLRQGK